MRTFLALGMVLVAGAAQAQSAPPSPPAECHTLTPAQARDALKFLGRVDLKGAEAPNFMALGEAVQALALLGQK